MVIRRKSPHSQPAGFEPLEGRQLLSGEPWGVFPRIIDQDVAVASYPNVTGAGTSIAILDSGIDYDHPALGGGFGAGHKVVAGYDFVDGDSNPMDTDGHGTGVATIAAGNRYLYQGKAYQGIAPGANLIALRIDDGSENIPDSRYEDALQWVIDHRVQYNIVAINISEGGNISFPNKTDNGSIYSDELATLKAAGVLIAVSSGNDGVTDPPGIEYPAADPSAYAIGSTNNKDQVSSFTSRSSDLDLLAPGEQVPTAVLNLQGQPIYWLADGTSYSSPAVAGAAALLRQVNPALSPAQIMSILKSTGAPVYDPATGLNFRRLDVNDAIKSAYAGLGQYRPSVGGDGLDSDIAFTRTGWLCMTWYDSAENNLKYASRSPGGTWSSARIVDDSADVGRYPSIAIDKNGRAGIAYYDVTNGNLKYAHYNGSSWSVSTVHSTGNIGLHPSLAFDSAARASISYYDATNGDLKYARWSGTSWGRRTIDGTGDVGRFSSIAYNPSTGRFGIAYERRDTGQYRYASQGSSTWSLRTVDSPGNGGGYISLAFDRSRRPAFSYYDAYNTNLKFAHYNGSTWRVQTVSTSGINGQYTNLMFDSSGKANIVYYRTTNDSVYLAVGDIGSWNLSQLSSSAGWGVSAALGPNDRLDYACSSLGSNDVHVMDLL